MEKKMHLFDAIAEMRKLTHEGEHFSIAFMSCDMGRQRSSGLKEIPKARLRSATPKEHNQYSDYMLNFLDVTLNRPGHFWQPCLLYFNEFKIEL